MGILSGLRILEIAGIGPAPFCGMLLADLGAEVILLERAMPRPGDPLEMGVKNILNRGKRSLALDLKKEGAVEAVLEIVSGADALLEGMRPGAMERLGLGPQPCLSRNPRLVYGRMTGWGQDGPLSPFAGHDLNYISLSGALWYAGAPGTPPLAPPTLVGDLGGGALYLCVGVLAALLHARATGCGQVVDAAIVDGSAHLMNLLLAFHAAGRMPFERGQGLVDGPHWYGTYRCADGRHLSLAPVEGQFYRLLLQKLDLHEDPDFLEPYEPRSWDRARVKLEALFASRPLEHWAALLEGSDACFAPVLDPREAMDHPHLRARGVYAEPGGILQAAPAPRFSGFKHQPGPVPPRGAHGREILREAGLGEAKIAALLEKGGD
ncbi:MAG: CoA transferase [Acidobacteria bacterium]|nr:CoA transferase [Acidobacteriota bacterium]